MLTLKQQLENFSTTKAMHTLAEKYELLLKAIKSAQRDVYIWGTGRLGKYSFAQCAKNNIKVKGFIDNNKQNWNSEKMIYSCTILAPDDIIIIASFFYPEIIEQIRKIGVKHYIYYEELAYLIPDMETYYPAFVNVFDDLETNKDSYLKIYDLLADSLSKDIYYKLVQFRATLDSKYTTEALNLSLQEGIVDFDKLIVRKLDEKYTFFDVGGFDGSSTFDFIHSVKTYNEVYYFEPDEKSLKYAQEKLKQFSKIIYIQAGVGERTGYENYTAIGDGGGFISKDANIDCESVRMVVLDDFIKSPKSYIKMDIEGYELQALRGAEKSIKQYKPMLSISIYHRPEDLYSLIPLILSWNPKYKVYLRHYTNTYADTRAYFI